MGPITYSLCHKPIIGVVLWMSFLCTFPPLIEEKNISLENSGMILNQEFEAPVEKSYPLELSFTFPSTESRLIDEIVGYRFDENCIGNKLYEEIPEKKRIGLGRPIPLKVVLHKLPEKTIALETIFWSLCVSSWADNRKWRTVGYLNLERSNYAIEVFNEVPQVGLGDVKTSISLVGGVKK